MIYLNKTINNHYEILGVKENASLEEIKTAYRKKALETHPDIHGNSDNSSHEKMIDVNLAYEILGDPQKRQHFDNLLNSEKLYKKNENSEYQKKEYQKAKDKYEESENEARERVKRWFYENLDVMPPKHKYRYGICNNDTKLDNLIQQIHNIIGDKIWEYRVKYLMISDDIIQYEIKIVLTPSRTGFKECHNDWVDNYYHGLFKSGTKEDYEFNLKRVDSWLKTILESVSLSFNYKVFFGIVGSYSAPWRCYLTLTVNLAITPLEIFYLKCHSRLSKYGKENKKSIGSIFNELAIKSGLSPYKLNFNKRLRDNLVSESQKTHKILKKY